MESTELKATKNNPDPARAVVNVNSGAYNAQKQVNMAIMRKIGQLVIALRPEELVVQGENIYWKVPLCVVNLSGDEKKYPLQSYALVDAISQNYTMRDEFVKRILAESTPIIHRLYSKLEA